jgi:sugar O-acyltransferase (sialic acid O-acetyltransferase NeuD family)
MKPVVIFGTGDFAQVAAVYLREDSPHQVAAFTVDEAHLTERTLLDREVVPFETLEETHPPDEFAMFVAVGFRKVNRVRAAIYERSKLKGYELITYVSSKATRVGPVTLGDNCFVFENNVLQPFVAIGNDVILWSGSHIGHHASIGDHSFIASHAVISGRVKIEDHCFVGVNVTIRDHVTIASGSVLGAGALILKGTQQDGVYLAQAAELSRVPSHRLARL